MFVKGIIGKDTHPPTLGKVRVLQRAFLADPVWRSDCCTQRKGWVTSAVMSRLVSNMLGSTVDQTKDVRV